MDKERLFKLLDRKYCSKSEIIPNIPLGEDADAIWMEILQSRRARGIELPLTNLNGDAYWYILTSKMISASEVIVNELMEQETAAEPHKSSVSTIEEVYYTGFMEGAQISVQDAMEFLQSGGEPESVEELILLNSRQAAGFAAENMYHAIDSNYLHNLAYFLTEGLDNGSGDFRLTDTIEIPSMQGETVTLPPADMIPEQTERFAGFLANTATHPLIKAAAAQAWVLAYRPFPEGNERLARLLSNVILIRAGYGFFGEISISSILAQTSYEYFRAIANILRIENGADLTYFLEYYLVSLSAAVNEMKARRTQQAEAVVEAEQKLASVPLQAPEQETAASHIGNPTLLAIHEERVQKVKVGLDTLMAQGVEQFTLGDLADVTGISRKYLSKLIRPYEDSEQVIAVRKAKTGNIYAFRRSSPPDDENTTAFLQEERREIDSELQEYAISAIKDRIAVGTSNSVKVAKTLLHYIECGKFDFTTNDIVQAAEIPVASVRNSLQYYLVNDVLRVIENRRATFRFEFCFLKESANNDEAVNHSETTITSPKAYLESLAEKSSGQNLTAVAKLLLDFMSSGYTEFSSFDVADALHLSRKIVNNHLRSFAENGILSVARVESHIKYFRFNEMTDMHSHDKTSEDGVLKELQNLSQSKNEKIRMFSEMFMRYLHEGKTSFTTEEITEETGLPNDVIHNTLRTFRYNGLIEKKIVGADRFHVYSFAAIQEDQTYSTDYSDAVIKMIEELEKSTSSQKDRRIGCILHRCLEKGLVTRQDYADDGALTRWKTDMQFASELGLVTRISSGKYRIMQELGPTGTRLRSAQKATLSLLYDLFGDGAFSAEMAIANLDYSSAHVSGILHQFTWLKLLDCTMDEGNSYRYQLNVNPTDNPECFIKAA